MSKKQIAAITEKLDIPAPSLTPKELVSKIYEATKNEEKLWRFKWEIKKPEDLKASIVILALLLQENIHPELVNIILQHSIQNWYNEGGIDLNITRIISSSEDNLLDYAIQGCNYEHFRKLIELNVNYLDCLWSIPSWPGEIMKIRTYTEKDRENRIKMLKDLLNLWVKVTEEFINRLTMHWESNFFEIAAESESWKKLLTPSFLEELMESCKQRQRNKDTHMLTAIIKLHKRKKVEEILKQEETKEWMNEMLLITGWEIKKKALSIINSPEFKAQAVEELLHYYWDDLAFQIAKWLRKKILENPKQILDLLLPKS